MATYKPKEKKRWWQPWKRVDHIGNPNPIEIEVTMGIEGYLDRKYAHWMEPISNG